MVSEVSAATAALAEGLPVVLCDTAQGWSATALASSHVQVAMMRDVVRTGPFGVVMSTQQARVVGLDMLTGAGTVTVDAAGSRHGANIDELARTCRALGGSATTGAGFRVPGHVRCDLVRADDAASGIPEAAITLTALAGCSESAILAPVVGERGHLMEVDQARRRGTRAGLVCVDARDLLAVGEAVTCRLPTVFGDFDLVAAQGERGGPVVLTLLYGRPQAAGGGVLVAAHQACLLGDTLGSVACSCRADLHESVRAIVQAGSGIVIYRAGMFDGRLCTEVGASADLDTAVRTVITRLGLREPAVRGHALGTSASNR